MMLEHGADPHARNDEGYTAWGRIPSSCPCTAPGCLDTSSFYAAIANT